MKNELQDLLAKMIAYFEGDVKRINHALKVYSFARNIAILEHLDVKKTEIVEAAAILHDIGIKVSEQKYNSSAGKYQELEGPAVASELLEGWSFEFVQRVCYLIGHHHTYSAIDDMDFQILVEADFLVNIFEDNYNREQISTVKEKYFKTKTGIGYINSMY